MTVAPERFRAALREAGIPDGFSVVHGAQLIPRAVIREIERFIEVFERVTTRPEWQRALTADAPPWARRSRGEACFFSAWDFHLPDGGTDWQLIEVNDNGSGFLFASIINATYAELSSLASDPRIDASPGRTRFDDRLLEMIEHEARRFYGDLPDGLFFILDDADSLARGHFRGEHELLAALVRTRGWDTAIGSPETLSASGRTLQNHGRDVSFVVNRSTDFLWEANAFGPLRECFAAGTVYVAPNPFTYLTRSDKRTLELLSHADRDDELGIAPDERAALDAHVPETILLRESNVDELARRKHDLFFKPAHGYASHGTIPGAEVGRERLRRLLRAGQPYVAQRFVPKGRLSLPGSDEPLRADLRVWAYRGERYLLSGRATRSERRLDVRSGGWIPTFVIDDSAERFVHPPEHLPHRNLKEDLASMKTIKLERTAWKPYFDDMTEVLAGQQAYVEVASLALGDQVAVEWAQLRGIVYDPKNDLFELAVEDLDHLIYGPKVVHVSYGEQGVEAIEIVDRDDVRQIVRLRAPLPLPPPPGAERAEESVE